MIQASSFEIQRYNFTPKLFADFQQTHFAKDQWPIVYILSNGDIMEAYVGETTDTYARMASHLKSDAKNILSTVHLISSEKFNKSATLDIESNLIKYISGDGQYKLLNGNIGLANHNYYQKKEVYWDIFRSIWNKLIREGITKHSIEYINNSDLFKYSPYKTLTREQKEGLVTIIDGLLSNQFKNIVVEGGAGTGKTIMAIFLFKLLYSKFEEFNYKEFGDDESQFIKSVKALKCKYPDPKMALVIPMASFRETLKKVFKNIKGLNSKMVIGPADLKDASYDILIVDESHRLRRRVNLGAYFHAFDVACSKLGFDKNSCSELDWVLKQSNKAILFYDKGQSIKPSDTREEDFYRLKALSSTKTEFLKSQFRVKGGNGYVRHVENLLTCSFDLKHSIYHSKDYEFVLFDSIESMVRQIKLRDSESGLSRLIAGFSWPWISKADKSLYDIEIDGFKLKWNSVAVDYINSPNAINEVGCIHTTQGYDLNYSGIIFGNEISYDEEKNEIVIVKDNYFDKNGKQSITDPLELKEYILNIYKTILLRAIKGTYVYVCDRKLRRYFKNYIENTFSEREIIPTSPKLIPYVNSVPILNLKAAAGGFSELQKADENLNDFDWVEIPPRYKPSKELFACQVVGESMNKIIPNGSICLFRKDGGGSRNGKIVLVSSTNIQDKEFGSSYTVKEYLSTKHFGDDQWGHKLIKLIPRSFDNNYKELVLSEEDLTDFEVVGIFECVL